MGTWTWVSQKEKIKAWFNTHKKLVIIGVVALILVTFGGVALYRKKTKGYVFSYKSF